MHKQFPRSAQALLDMHELIDRLDLPAAERVALKAKTTSLVMIVADEATDAVQHVKRLASLFTRNMKKG